MRFVMIIAAITVAISATTVLAEAPASGTQTLYTLPHVPGQILVKRTPGTPDTVIVQILSGLGGTVLDFSASAQLDVVAINDDNALESAITLLNANAGIEIAEPNYTTSLWATPNDIDFPQQWSKDNTALNSPSGLGHAGADLNLIDAWDTQATAPGVIIAIIDDSLETTHLDLAANVMAGGRCFASPNSARPCVNGANDPNPVDANDFHGTLVAGTAAGRGNNGIGVAGAVWETNLLPLKVDLSYFAIVEAVDEAIAQGADIINMSFGGPAKSQALSEAIRRAEVAGILVVAAAGNADANNEIATHHPSNEPQKNVISVASSESRDRLSGFSQWGASAVHLAAPGELVRTTAIGNSYANVSGTSFSAPHTSGVAALLYANSGANNYEQVKAHLLHGTVDGRDALGPVNPGQDKEAIPGRVATGRLDADKALTGPAGGVLLISNIQINDAATGNANGVLDPGESAQIQITLANAWTNEAAVNGTLSSRDNGTIFVNDVTPVTFGTINKDGQGTASFSVTLSNSVTGNAVLFMQLDLTSATSGTLPSRYFYLEIGTLRNADTVSQNVQRYNWDEFQAFHVDVPAGSSNLSIATTGSGDVDLLVRYDRSPEYLITLNSTPGSGFYFVDSQTTASAGSGANESVAISNPLPGTYHAVVVNYDQLPKSYDITANFDLPSQGQIEFTQAIYSASEDSTTATISVSRSGAVGGAVVEYDTAAMTATAGDDYVSSSGVLVWDAGENGSKTFTVAILDDQQQEGTETVQLLLSNVIGSTLGQQNSATLEIDDNEPPLDTLVFAQAAYTVSESVPQVTVSVTRSGSAAGQATVDFATGNGQAIAGSDFVNTSGVLTWADGESGAKTINISIMNDSGQENQESFSVNLSNPQGAAIGNPGTTTVSINDDDVVAAGGNSGGGSTNIAMLALLALTVLLRSRHRRPARRRVVPGLV